MGPPTLGIRGTPAVPAVSASVTVNVTATSTVLVERLPAGVSGNDWEIQIGVTSAVLNGGIQVLTVVGANNTLAVTIQDTDIPTIAEFAAAITNHFEGGFRATATTANPNAQISTALAALLPGGTTGNNTRSEDFTGGVNAVAAIPAQAAVAAASAEVILRTSATGNIRVRRLPVGSAGNDWDIVLITTDSMQNPDGLVFTVANFEGTDRLEVQISTSNIPTLGEFRDAINSEISADFDATLQGDALATDALSTNVAILLPNGVSLGSSRREDFSGGTDAIPAMQDLPAGVDTPAVAASILIVLPDGGILVTRDTVGEDGNLWSLTIEPAVLSLFGASSDGVITQLAASGGGGGTLRVMLATNNVPLVLDVVFDINASVGFNAVLVGGADEDLLSPITPETMLPDGGPFGTLGRIQSLAGGADFIPAPFDAPGTPAIPAMPGLGLEFTPTIDRWTLRVPPSGTLLQIFDFLADFPVPALDGSGDVFLTAEGADTSLVLPPGASVSTLNQGTYFNFNVGDSATVPFAGGINEVPAEASKDDEAQIISVNYGGPDTFMTIIDLLDGVVLDASLVGETPEDTVPETGGFTRVFRGVGGGGGGGGAVTLHKTTAEATKITFEEAFIASIDFTAINVAVDTGIAIPANTKTFHVNYGSSHVDDDDSGIDLIWFPVPIEEWERLDGVDVGDAPTQGNVRFTRSWRDTDVGTAGGVTARQVWLSRGNNGNIFVMTDNVGYDIFPFRVRFEIHEAVTFLADVTSTSAPVDPTAPVAPVAPVVPVVPSGGGLSEIRILAPTSVPDRDNWVEGAAQWTGESLVPIVRELAGVHEAIIHFATIDPANGMEIIETTDVYATMRNSANLNTTVAWLWVAGQLVRVGNLAYRVDGTDTNYYRCIRQHNTAAGDIANGPPNVPAQTGWEVYTPVSVVSPGSFRGVVRDTQDVVAPIASGDWVVTTAAGYAYPERYTINPDQWLRYIIPGVVLFGQIFTDNEEAYGHIRSFNSSEPQYLLIGGFLKIVTWYTAPAVGHESFHPRGSQKSNPRAYFWFKDQAVRNPQGSTFPLTLDVTNDGSVILEFQSEDPDETYDNGDVVYANGTAQTGVAPALFRRLLTPPRGRHDVTLILESSYSTIGDMLAFSLFKDVGLVDSRYLGQARFESIVAVMDITVTARLMIPDVETDGTENYYFRIDGLTALAQMPLRGYVLFEYKGDY